MLKYLIFNLGIAALLHFSIPYGPGFTNVLVFALWIIIVINLFGASTDFQKRLAAGRTKLIPIIPNSVKFVVIGTVTTVLVFNGFIITAVGYLLASLVSAYAIPEINAQIRVS